MRPITFVAFVVTLCGLAATAQAQIADRVLNNAKIETMNKAAPSATAVAIKDGKIIYVGDDAGAKAHIEDGTDVIDLKGKYVTPGFIDVHNHVIASDYMNGGVNLGAATSMDELVAMIKEYAEANPDLPLIQGNNYIPAKIGGNPSAAILDMAVSDRPVFISGNSNHDAVMNSAALEKAGINNETAVDTQPGLIYWERDANGDITGAAIETQYMKSMLDLGMWKPETMVEPIIEKMQGFLASEGVTTVQVPGIITPNFGVSSQGVRDDFEAILPLLAARVENGKAQMRLNVMPFLKLQDGDPDDYVAFAKRMREIYDTDMLRVDGFKLHADGLWPDRATANMEPYRTREDDVTPHLAPLGIDASRIHASIIKGAASDLTVITHADGTLIIKILVDSIALSKQLYPDSTARHRIDHASLIQPGTVAKIIEYDIPINATPIFYNENEVGPGGASVYDIFGEALVERSFGLYTDLAYKGVRVSLGGDAPGTVITEAYPIWLFQQSMTLMQPDAPEDAKPFPPFRSRFTIDKALASMTTVPASQLGMEDKIGSIEVGKYADLAIMDKDLREVPPEDLVKTVKVVGTILNGEFTHRKGV